MPNPTLRELYDYVNTSGTTVYWRPDGGVGDLQPNGLDGCEKWVEEGMHGGFVCCGTDGYFTAPQGEVDFDTAAGWLGANV